MNYSVTAVIVTYNRRDLLQKALETISEQTLKPNRLIIIDNASNDGTHEMLENYGWLNRSDIELLRLPINMGGAGGFHAGIQAAINYGTDWIWLMDDDGFPEHECLQKLLQFATENHLDAISPIQVDIHNPNLPAFPIKSPSKEEIRDLKYKSVLA